MNRRFLIPGVLLLAVLSWYRVAGAQSLADVAAKEQERRKKVTTPSKVYTNGDLAGAPAISIAGPAGDSAADASKTGGQASAIPSATQATSGSETANVNREADAAQEEKQWRARMEGARSNLARQELFLEALQSRVNGLTTDFVNRDDPAQRGELSADRQKALAEMERVRADIQRLKTEIVQIEEDARRAGVPPGWVR